MEGTDEESAIRMSVRALRDERGDDRTVMSTAEIHEPVERKWHTPGADKISLKEAQAHSAYTAKVEQGRAYARQFGLELDDGAAYTVSDTAATPQGGDFSVPKQPSELRETKAIVADGEGNVFAPIDDRDRSLMIGREDTGNLAEVTAALARGRQVQAAIEEESVANLQRLADEMKTNQE